MPITVLASVFSGPNQTGTSRVYGVGTSGRYFRVRRSTLSAAGLRAQISSATLYSSPTSHTTLLLFGFPGGFLTLPDFTGAFVQLTNAISGQEFDTNLAPNFDNMATSLLLVRTAKANEIRVSFRDIFLTKWKSVIDAALSGGAKRHGDPTLTWEMFPLAVSYLDSSLMYLKIHQRLDIEIDWWPDYEATITYHIFLYLDGAKHVRGFVARWAYWIEGGVKSDDIEDKLRPAVIAGANTLNAELGSALNLLSFLPFSELYYLPGRQLTPAPTGALNGWTYDDVTIVLQP